MRVVVLSPPDAIEARLQGLRAGVDEAHADTIDPVELEARLTLLVARAPNRPARTGGALADRGAVSTNSWVEYDVTAAVGGNGSISFVLATTSSDGLDLRSREYGTSSQRPQLVVTFAP